MTKKLLIIGASVRAAAESASRAPRLGPIVACDLFADTDLRRLAAATRLSPAEYPRGFLPWALAQSPAQWMYTGGLENEPQLIDHISRRHTLLGNPADVVRRVRNPREWPTHVMRQGLHAGTVAGASEVVRDRDRWLIKPVRSCGGLRIRRLAATTEIDEDHEYCQEFVDGASRAGLFVADANRSRLLGVMASWTLADCAAAGDDVSRGGGRSLNGPSSWLDKPYAYAGSTGPLPLSTDQRRSWEQIGQVIHREFGLRGVFGVDAIETPAGDPGKPGRLVVLEINPRFTASMELLDHGGGVPVVEQHVAACSGQPLPGESPADGQQPTVAGKAILYAERDLCWNAELRLRMIDGAQAAGAWLADLPTEGACIGAGQPVVTCLCTGHKPAEIARRLGLSGHNGLWQQFSTILRRHWSER